MERVLLRDLQDVVYYRQVKDYTDQEYEASKDLRNALNLGKLTKIDHTLSVRGSSSISAASGDIAAEVRAAIRDSMPASQSMDHAALARELAPVVAGIVRQEMASMPSYRPTQEVGTGKVPTFVDPSYVPTVTTEGMTSNIEAKETAVSGNDADDALAMLRRMGK